MLDINFDGTVVIAGSPQHINPSKPSGFTGRHYYANTNAITGAAIVYELNDSTWTPTIIYPSEEDDVLPTTEHNTFGYSVDINNAGTIIAVGAYGVTTGGSEINGNNYVPSADESDRWNIGYVSLYKKDENGRTKIGSNKYGTEKQEVLGYTVELDKTGTTMIASGYNYNFGTVKVYRSSY